MKKILFAFFILLITLPVMSQVKGSMHSKLANYYQNEQWEDCAFKADRMILQEKYRNDAEVYLYLAASYNKIFLLGLADSTLLMLVPEYANAYKLALKYSAYSKKKDKKAGFYFPENNDMLEEIAICGTHYIDHYFEVGKISKARSYLRKIMKMHTDLNVYFLYGVTCAMTGDDETYSEVMDSVFRTMDNQRPSGIENTNFMMVDGFDVYATYLMNLEQALTDSAKSFTQRGLRYFPDNELLKWNLQWIDNPEIMSTKPENALKVEALKRVALIIPGEDEDSDDGEFDEDEDE
jgi:tetratricopeptide (TPR) repeat protein